jgi:hypothetical protein
VLFSLRYCFRSDVSIRLVAIFYDVHSHLLFFGFYSFTYCHGQMMFFTWSKSSEECGCWYDYFWVYTIAVVHYKA